MRTGTRGTLKVELAILTCLIVLLTGTSWVMAQSTLLNLDDPAKLKFVVPCPNERGFYGVDVVGVLRPGIDLSKDEPTAKEILDRAMRAVREKCPKLQQDEIRVTIFRGNPAALDVVKPVAFQAFS